jgi:hypothetical protein
MLFFLFTLCLLLLLSSSPPPPPSRKSSSSSSPPASPSSRLTSMYSSFVKRDHDHLVITDDRVDDNSSRTVPIPFSDDHPFTATVYPPFGAEQLDDSACPQSVIAVGKARKRNMFLAVDPASSMMSDNEFQPMTPDTRFKQLRFKDAEHDDFTVRLRKDEKSKKHLRQSFYITLHYIHSYNNNNQ